MAATSKKSSVRKQKSVAAKKAQPKGQVKSKVKAKEVKAAATGKSKVQVKAKPKPKAAKVPATKKAKVQVKAKPKKAVAMPSKNNRAPQKKVAAKKPEKKTLAGRKSTALKKSSAAVAPAGERYRGLKSMLVAKRDALLKEAKQEIQKYVSGENRQLVDTAIDEADWAAVEISEDINLKRLSAQRQLLNDVEECLRKVSEGTYGICEDCGEEISEKRLRVIPTATLCIDCKEQREKMAILEQETEI